MSRMYTILFITYRVYTCSMIIFQYKKSGMVLWHTYSMQSNKALTNVHWGPKKSTMLDSQWLFKVTFSWVFLWPYICKYHSIYSSSTNWIKTEVKSMMSFWEILVILLSSSIIYKIATLKTIISCIFVGIFKQIFISKSCQSRLWLIYKTVTVRLLLNCINKWWLLFKIQNNEFKLNT